MGIVYVEIILASFYLINLVCGQVLRSLWEILSTQRRECHGHRLSGHYGHITHCHLVLHEIG
jgi:hypothetical protein